MSKWRVITTWVAAGVALMLTGTAVWAFPLRVPTRPSDTIAIGGKGSASDGVQEQTAPHEVSASQLNQVRVVTPQYPARAKKAGIQGTVVLEATINKKGAVKKLELISGPPALVKSAEKAVKHWRYARGPLLPARTRLGLLYTHGMLYPGGPSVFDPWINVGLKPPSGLKVTHYVSPTYPPSAKRTTVESTAVLRITVDKAGNVSNVRALSGRPVLIEAAEKAVELWKFAPPASAPVETSVSVGFWTPPKESRALNDWSVWLVGAEKRHLRKVYTSRPGIILPRTSYAPDPPYTQKARTQRVQGSVVLAVVISARGRVAGLAEISKPLGEGLDESALQTVSQWRFTPAELAGAPVAVKLLVQITFHLL